MKSPSTTIEPVASGSPTTDDTPQSASLFKYCKLIFVVSFFLAGVLSIIVSQFIIIVFTFHNPEVRRLLLNFTKSNFIIMLVFITKIASPTRLIISHDRTIPQNTFQYTNILDNKVLKSYLDDNAIVIANHQIYIDWIYIWFLAYCNQLGNNVYIIMKESLKKLPLLGYGMKNYNFIFLSRKWEQDRSIMTDQLSTIDFYSRNLQDKSKYLNLQKHWLILFPEGTNMSLDRLEKSNNWCDKIDTPRLKNVLLPRVKGLYFAATKLSETTKTIYNVTLGYKGVRQDQFAQDIYTMSKIFLHGEGPKEVHIHFSKTNISDIDNFEFGKTLSGEDEVSNMANFEKWLYRKWYQKDELMNGFYLNGKFIDDEFTYYETELKINSNLDLLRIFIIPIGFSLILYSFYNFIFD